MLFHVRIDIRIPHDIDPERLRELNAREHERAKELQLQRKWMHLWRIAGKYANISIFDVESPAELHEILNSLPLVSIHGGRGSRALPPSGLAGLSSKPRARVFRPDSPAEKEDRQRCLNRTSGSRLPFTRN